MVSTCRTWNRAAIIQIWKAFGEGFDRFLMRLQGVGTIQEKVVDFLPLKCGIHKQQQWGAPVAAAREIRIFASVPRHC